jgi:tetrahydromethanopterin S-methyltransferase subunit E
VGAGKGSERGSEMNDGSDVALLPVVAASGALAALSGEPFALALLALLTGVVAVFLVQRVRGRRQVPIVRDPDRASAPMVEGQPAEEQRGGGR